MLTDEDIDVLLDRQDYLGIRGMLLEAVRLTALRCAALCREHKGYEMEERAADACAAEIEERITDKAYAKANPLGGPASMFRAIAERIEAGEPYAGVLRDYGVTVESKDKPRPHFNPNEGFGPI